MTGANERIMHVYECRGTEMCEVNEIHNVVHVCTCCTQWVSGFSFTWLLFSAFSFKSDVRAVRVCWS